MQSFLQRDFSLNGINSFRKIGACFNISSSITDPEFNSMCLKVKTAGVVHFRIKLIDAMNVSERKNMKLRHLFLSAW